MQRLSFCLTILLAFAFADKARAQEVSTNGPSFEGAPAAGAPEPAPAGKNTLVVGLDAAFQVPLGNLANVTGIGLGGLVRGEYRLVTNLSASVRAGYIYSLKKDNSGLKTNIDEIPIWAGAKFFLTDMIYAGAELGINMLKTYVEGSVGGISANGSSSRDTEFGADVGVGVLLGDLDARLQFQILDFNHTGDSKALMLNVGYNFFSL
jgi:hypothetical protein